MNDKELELRRLRSNINSLLNKIDSISIEQIKKLNTTIENLYSKENLKELNALSDKIFNVEDEIER